MNCDNAWIHADHTDLTNTLRTANTEIEQLRADRDRLQALIDTWAGAYEKWTARCAANSLFPEGPEDSIGLPTLMAAERALLAAATPKEDEP